jgi:transposase-like protein
MKYDGEFVNRVAGTVASGRCSIRKASRLLGVSRKTISRWVNRILDGLPARMMRKARHVRNGTSRRVLQELKRLLVLGRSAVRAWAETCKEASIRTVQRWKAKRFPRKMERKPCRRYERGKALTLVHTDWGVKRIKGGKRM